MVHFTSKKTFSTSLLGAGVNAQFLLFQFGQSSFPVWIMSSNKYDFNSDVEKHLSMNEMKSFTMYASNNSVIFFCLFSILLAA